MVGSFEYSLGSMKVPGSIASIGMTGGSRGGQALTAASRSVFHLFKTSLAFCARVSWVSLFFVTSDELFFSIMSRARVVTRSPGVFRSPLSATTQAQIENGSDHALAARTRRAVP